MGPYSKDLQTYILCRPEQHTTSQKPAKSASSGHKYAKLRSCLRRNTRPNLNASGRWLGRHSCQNGPNHGDFAKQAYRIRRSQERHRIAPSGNPTSRKAPKTRICWCVRVLSIWYKITH